MRTFKYSLYPSKEQQNKLWKHANKLNWMYNYFLNQKNEAYKNNKTIIKQYDQQKEIIKLKQTDSVIKEIHSQVLQSVTSRLDKNYQWFFKQHKNNKNAGLPKFRSCKKFFGINYPQSGYSINKNIFKTKVYGDILFSKHRKINGNIKQIFISNKNNKWYLNVVTDYVENNSKNSNKVGIDIGLKNLVVATDGIKIENRTDSKYFDKQISKIQSRLSKTKKNSNRHKFLKNLLQKLYDVKVKKINDFQHKVSKYLACKYDTIFAEDLSVKSMIESEYTSLNKNIRNAKLAQFLSFLKYKVNNLVLVNPKFTSKMCNNCGYVHNNLKLSERIINCSCGIIYDRDENAAKNIFCLGQTILNKGCLQSNTIVEVFNLNKNSSLAKNS